MTRKDVATMATGEWLNDEMVNFTIGTMADREMARCGGTQPRVHFFNTFFVGQVDDSGRRVRLQRGSALDDGEEGEFLFVL